MAVTRGKGKTRDCKIYGEGLEEGLIWHTGREDFLQIPRTLRTLTITCTHKSTLTSTVSARSLQKRPGTLCKRSSALWLFLGRGDVQTHSVRLGDIRVPAITALSKGDLPYSTVARDQTVKTSDHPLLRIVLN